MRLEYAEAVPVESVARTVKPGAAKLGLTYRAATGEVAHSTQSLRLPR